MHRPVRALVLMLLITVAYNITVVIGQHIYAPALTGALALVEHGRGFTLGIAAGCIATGEVGILAVIALAILLVTWPTDLVRLSFALVAGGLLGLALRSFIRAHHDRESLPRQRDAD
jgi:hypothetical protein